MTILLTGGAGFIGANFIYYELNSHPEDRIVCLDALTYAGNLSTLEEALRNPNFAFYKVDNNASPVLVLLNFGFMFASLLLDNLCNFLVADLSILD